MLTRLGPLRLRTQARDKEKRRFVEFLKVTKPHTEHSEQNRGYGQHVLALSHFILSVSDWQACYSNSMKYSWQEWNKMAAAMLEVGVRW